MSPSPLQEAAFARAMVTPEERLREALASLAEAENRVRSLVLLMGPTRAAAVFGISRQAVHKKYGPRL